MRRWRPAVESATDSLGHRGLDRGMAFGTDGFARVVATDVHRIGPLLRREARKRRPRAA